MKVFVLDGHQNQSVATVRSLAKAGYKVLVGESDGWSKAGWSRFCSGTSHYPDPRKDATGFVKRVAEIAGQESGTLVLPMTEKTTLPISAHRDVLRSANARFVLPSHEQVLQAFNKERMIQLASSLGIATPKTVTVSCAEHKPNLRERLNFPLVLKPRSSVETRQDGNVRISGRPCYAKNNAELEEHFRSLKTRCSEVLIQEFVDGKGTGYFALMKEGELRAEFAHRRIRDVHPTGSGSALRVSVAPDPEVREASLALLQALRWHGVAMVEFRQVPGKPPVFMEVNGRFWNSLPLACYAGMDFPTLLARMAEIGDVEPHLQFSSGVSCRWLLGDFRHLFEVWRGAPVGYPRRYPGRLRALLSFLTPVRGTFHDNFQWKDPLPEAGDWLALVQQAFRKALS